MMAGRLGSGRINEVRGKSSRDRADALEIPGAKILERQEIPEDGGVGFIVDEKEDIRCTAIDIPGVVEIEPLRD